jgi:ABC-2 type transport system ATP-binding protein
VRVFTYHEKSELRGLVNGMLLIIPFDAILLAVLAIVLPNPWNWVALAAGVAFSGFGFIVLTSVIRTKHTVDAQNLTLNYGSFSTKIPLSQIRRASLLQGPLPNKVEVPSFNPAYRSEDDTLYLLAGKKSLVEVLLASPSDAKVKTHVQFTRVVLNLDEPAEFVAALSGGDSPSTAESAQPTVSSGTDVSELTQRFVQSAGSADEEAAIQMEGLRKVYGDFAAVKGIDLRVAPGEIFAFLGGNGAGKTTTIKMLVGLLEPTGGQAWISGHNVWTANTEARRNLGYVPDIPLLYETLTAREFLWLIAGLYEMSESVGRARAEELLAFLDMQRWGDQLIRNFSLGMKRKMAIAAALMHRPKVLLLDEVTNGLDPRASREVKDLIGQMARQGTAIFLTTHILSVVEELAHRIAIIDQGSLRALGTMAELQEQAGKPDASLEDLFLAFTGAPAREGTSV